MNQFRWPIIIGMFLFSFLAFSKDNSKEFNPYDLNIQKDYPLVYTALQKSLINPSEGASELRKLLKNDGGHTWVAIQTLMFLREEELKKQYPELNGEYNALKENSMMTPSYGSLLLKKKKYLDVIPTLILEVEFLNSTASILLWNIYLSGLADAARPFDKRIFELFKKLADEKLERYLFYYGQILSFGLGVPQDVKKGEETLKSCTLPEAKVALGKLYQNHYKRYDEAKKLYLQAINENYPDAYEQLGHLEYGRKNYDLAFQNYLQMYKAYPENSQNMTTLGLMYIHGEGTKASCLKGLELLQLAADKYEDEAAQFFMYFIHASPQKDIRYSCFKRTFEQGILYLNKSAEQGYPNALEEQKRLMSVLKKHYLSR